jgi:hypothetical protein
MEWSAPPADVVTHPPICYSYAHSSPPLFSYVRITDMRRSLAIATIALITCVAGMNGDATTSFARERSIQFSEDLAAIDAVDSSTPTEVTDLPSFQFQPSPPTVEDTTSTMDCGCECECVADCDCCCEPHGGWTFELGASALQSESAVPNDGDWPDNFGPAGRIALGHEWENGFGIRAQSSTYYVEGDIGSQTQLFSPFYFYDPYFYNYPLYPSLRSYPYTRPIEITATTAYLDFFKSFYSRNGEFSLGMGPAFGYLQFNFPPYGGSDNYTGGGLTVSGRGYVPVYERNRWQFGLTGQTRATLLGGHWHTDSSAVADVGGTISIVELRLGPEFRHRIGPTADRYLFLRTVAEFQQWRGDGLGPMGGDALAMHGVSLDCGVLW